MFDRIPKIVGSLDLGHAHLRPLGIPDTELHTKFEVCSSSSFKDMFDRIPKIVAAHVT